MVEHWPTFIEEVRATWMTIDEVAEEYGLNARYVRSLMENRRIEVFKLDRKYQVNPASVDAFLASQHHKVSTR